MSEERSPSVRARCPHCGCELTTYGACSFGCPESASTSPTVPVHKRVEKADGSFRLACKWAFFSGMTWTDEWDKTTCPKCKNPTPNDHDAQLDTSAMPRSEPTEPENARRSSAATS